MPCDSESETFTCGCVIGLGWLGSRSWASTRFVFVVPFRSFYDSETADARPRAPRPTMTGVMNIPRHAGDEFLVCQTALRNTQNAASIRNCSIPAAYGVPAHLSRNYNVQHGVVFRFTPPVCNTSGVTTHSTIQRRSRLPPASPLHRRPLPDGDP